MDSRWTACGINSYRDVRVILHSRASIEEVRAGTALPSDATDLTPLMTTGTQSQFEVSVTFAFRRELFGAGQPRPNQILEVQLWQSGAFQTLWIGIITAISSVTQTKGERSMQLTARSRDSQDNWRVVKRVTPIFPVMTDYCYMARRVAEATGMTQDEILLPVSALQTQHINTQFTDMTAWEIIANIFQALGWTPFVDSLGRLRYANRELQGRVADVIMLDNRVIKIGAQRQKPPTTRVRVKWLDPVLKWAPQQGQLLMTTNITFGWFLPFWKQKVWFSDDHSMRAINTKMEIRKSCNTLVNFHLGIKFCTEDYVPLTNTYGEIYLVNFLFSLAVFDLIMLWQASHVKSDGVLGEAPVTVAGLGISGGAAHITPPPGALGGVVTVPGDKSFSQQFIQYSFLMLMVLVGSGQYEIFGQPVNHVHPKNITDAFDISAPTWADNPQEIDNDFMVNEQHAKAVAVRELIFQARAANKWTVTVVDDPRIEMGDIVQFFDGTKIYVEDYRRTLQRGAEATLELQGFLVGSGALAMSSATGLAGGTRNTGDPTFPGGPSTPPAPITPPGSGGGGGQPTQAEHDQFLAWVAGTPGTWAQTTAGMKVPQDFLIALVPTLEAAGWKLTPPNAHGDRTKVHTPSGNWMRVGFGEGHWVWLFEVHGP